MIDIQRIVGLLALSAGLLGCEAAITTAVGPTVDTRGRVGIDGRAELALAIGAKDGMLSIVTGPGGGYDQATGPYFTHSIQVGGQFGHLDALPLARGRVAVISNPRISEHGVQPSGGITGEALFGIPGADRAGRYFLIGPRLDALVVPALQGPGRRIPGLPEGLAEVRGLLSIACAQQWIFEQFHPEGPGPEVQPPLPPPPSPSPPPPTLVVPEEQPPPPPPPPLVVPEG